MTAVARVPKGRPTGGQFAQQERSEASVALAAPTVGEAFLEERLRREALWDQLTPEQVKEVQALVDGGLVFTDEAITAAANEVHAEAHGYTAAQARDALNTALRLELEGRPEDARAIRAVLGSTKQIPSFPMAPHADKVDSSDPRVQAGQVFDTVVVDGTVYQRRRDGVYPDTPYSMRIQSKRPLSDDDMQKAAQLLGYAYRAEVRGEPLGDPERDSPYSFVVYADTTKSSSDDLGIALEGFEESLPEMFADGSPIRKTDRAGAGTKGTRLVEGFDGDGFGFEIYYDDVVSG